MRKHNKHTLYEYLSLYYMYDTGLFLSAQQGFIYDIYKHMSV